MSDLSRFENRVVSCADCGAPVDELLDHPSGTYMLYSDHSRIVSDLRAQLEEARELLVGAQTHLLDGDNSIWRGRLDAFLSRTGGTKGE